MKIVGNVLPEYSTGEDGTAINNSDYIGGSIVVLTSREAHIISLLQHALDERELGIVARLDTSHSPMDRPMDTAFWLIYQFVKARFAINAFKQTVTEIEDTLAKMAERAE